MKIFISFFLPCLLFSTTVLSEGLIKKVTNDVTCHPLASAEKGDRVYITYTGQLATDGKTFDTNVGGKPLDYVLGSGVVISGWEMGLLGTCVGQTLSLTIPPELAYGEKGAGAGAIPPNAELIFTMTLVKLDKDLKISTTKEGDCSKDQKTRRRDIVTIHYIGKIAEANNTLRVYDESFAKQPLKLTLGTVGIEAFDKGVSGACLGEERTVVASPDKAYGVAGIPSILPPNSTIVLEITVKHIEDRVLSFLDRISSGTFGK